jgi:hypothetical protein
MSRRADWIDRAKFHLYRSTGRCVVAVMTDPQDAWHRIHVLESCDGFKSYVNLDPERRGRSMQEAIAVAEKAVPDADVHPNAMRIEPVRRGSDVTEAVDVWAAGRGSTRQRRLAGAGRGRRRVSCPANVGRMRAPKGLVPRRRGAR